MREKEEKIWTNKAKKRMNSCILPRLSIQTRLSPTVIILNIVMSVLGAIIGLELIVRTGVAPNTSIVGALFAIILSRIPLKFLQKYRSIHSQNMIQTAISGATFSAANSLLLPIGIPVIMGRWDLMMPLLVGVFIATIIDATILYKTFDSEMFPAEAHGRLEWRLLSLSLRVEKGRKAMLLLGGMVIGVGGKVIGIPTDFWVCPGLVILWQWQPLVWAVS